MIETWNIAAQPIGMSLRLHAIVEESRVCRNASKGAELRGPTPGPRTRVMLIAAKPLLAIRQHAEVVGARSQQGEILRKRNG